MPGSRRLKIACHSLVVQAREEQTAARGAEEWRTFSRLPARTIIPISPRQQRRSRTLGGAMARLISTVRIIGCSLALCSIVSPAVSQAQQATPQRGGTLVMVVQPEPPTLASYQSTSGPIGQVAAKVYEGLLEYDFNLGPIPGLAQSWTVSPDGKTITFRLQPGVKFHDGTPFTSADVKFSILEVRKKSNPRAPPPFRGVPKIA